MRGAAFKLTVGEWSWLAWLPSMTLHGIAVNWANVSTLLTLFVAAFVAAWPNNSMAVVRTLRFDWRMQAAAVALLVAGVLALANPTEFLYFNF
jgi:hypothetical protein